MNYSELLHNLFDRNLDSLQEDKLFTELASNDELRSELRQFIDMEFAVRRDFEAFHPEPESQDKIFGALGISTAAITGGAAATSALTSKAWLGQYMNNFLIGLGSLILGGLMTFFLLNDNSKSNTENLTSTTENSPNNKSGLVTGSDKNKIAVTESYSIDTIYKDRIVVKYIPGPERIVYLTKEDGTIEFENNLPQITSAKTEIDRNNLVGNYENNTDWNQFINNSDNQYSPYNFADFTNFLSNKLSFEFRANEDWSLPQADMPRSSYPVFNNTSATLLYDLSDDFKVGADVRQEYFYQKYNGIDDGKAAYNYYQHTNYISAGILARYSLINHSNMMMFVQPAISFNQVGVVARTMIGAEYEFVDRVSMIIGLEGSLLQFNHQGNNFYSPKIGFHYGVRFNP